MPAPLEPLDDLVERVYAKMSDATMGVSNGVMHITVDRERPNRHAALASVYADLAVLFD